MRVISMKTLGACALLTGLLAGPARAAKALPCADWITTQMHQEPLTGHLIGTTTVSITYQVIIAGSGVTVREEWEVGTYQMSNGTKLRIDCRDYTEYER